MQITTRFGTVHASIPREWSNRPVGAVRHISSTSRYGSRIRTLHLFAVGRLEVVVLTGAPFGVQA